MINSNSLVGRASSIPIQDIYQECWHGNYHERFGATMISADINGDGMQDIIVASENNLDAKLEWSTGMQAGKIRIIYNVV